MNNAQKLANEMQLALNHISNANKVANEMVTNNDSTFDDETIAVLVEEFKKMETSALKILNHLKGKR